MIAFLALLALHTSQNGLAEAHRLLERMAEKHRKLQVMAASFVQRVQTPLMRKPIVSRGRMLFRREPACAVFELAEPRRSICRFDATSYQVYRPGRREAERFLFTDGDLAGALVRVLAPKGADEIEKSFRIVRAATKGEKGQLREIALEPLRKSLADFMTELTLTVASGDLTISEIRYRNRDGDRVRIQITDYAMNPRIDPQRFEKDLPKGTKLRVHRVCCTVVPGTCSPPARPSSPDRGTILAIG